MIEQDTSNTRGALAMALSKLSEEIRDGLRHGFFQLEVTCELMNGRKRRLTIKTGKSHQFIIGEKELSD